MNWLAHTFLSEPSTDFQMGNLLADLLKMKAWDTISADAISGFNLHKDIDTYTDSHIYVKQTKQRLGESGLLRAVVVDLVFDHFLSIHWNLYSKIDLRLFLNDFYANVQKILSNYPIKAQKFMKMLIKSDRLGKYSQVNKIEETMKHLDNRLSARLLRRDQTISYFPSFRANYDEIQNSFLLFFPELLNHVKSKTNDKNHTYWK